MPRPHSVKRPPLRETHAFCCSISAAEMLQAAILGHFQTQNRDPLLLKML
ncbi:hypothetical protein [Paracoccus sp. SSK6]